MKKRLRIEYFLVAAVMLLLFVGSIAATNFSFKRNGCSARNLFKKKKYPFNRPVAPSVFEKGQLTNQQQLLVTHALDDAEERVTLLQKWYRLFDSSQNEPLESHKNDLKSLRFYQELPMVQLYERVKR